MTGLSSDGVKSQTLILQGASRFGFLGCVSHKPPTAAAKSSHSPCDWLNGDGVQADGVTDGGEILRSGIDPLVSAVTRDGSFTY